MWVPPGLLEREWTTRPSFPPFNPPCTLGMCRSSRHHVAAVGSERLAHIEIAIGGARQQQRRRRHLLGPAESAQRQLGGLVLLPLGRQALDERGLDRSGSDRVDQDAARCELQRE